ncbi:hypothetical protein OQA88_10934 [Cercophora sp. LCS_1]
MLLSFSVFASLALAAVVPGAVPQTEQAAQVCYAGETQSLLCYRAPQGTPQGVSVSDVALAASALREWGTELREKLDEDGNPIFDGNGLSIEEPFYRYLDMNKTADPEPCAEWTLLRLRSVLVAAKLMKRGKDALVWFGDIADAIDGGEHATPAQKNASISRCGTDGGSREVNATLKHEAYDPWRFDYESGAKIHTDIVIKVVADLDWRKAPAEGDEPPTSNKRGGKDE